MNRTISLIMLLTLQFTAACGGSKVIVTGTPTPPKTPLRLIAISANQNEFTQKFGEDLSQRGYGILDPQRTSTLLGKLDLENSDLMDAATLTELKNRRIDAIMKIVVEMTPTRADLLDKVKISVIGTGAGELLAGIDWTNSWGGMPGSPADSGMRLNIPNAARAVAVALTKQLGPPGLKASVMMDDLIAARKARVGAPAPQAIAAPAIPAAQIASSDVDAPARRGADRPNDFALLIGIDDYQSLPKAEFGVRDAQTVRKHFEAIGVPARNIISLEGSQATGGKLKSYLQQWLPRNVKPESTLFVYYSGHGAPDPASGDAYLVPWDTDPMFLETTAYPLKQFYSELTSLKAKRVLVALDACFSGSGGRSVLAKGARPLVAKVDESVPVAANLTVLAAASGSEITGTLDDQAHGMFTYHFLKALSGGAKTPRAMLDYLKPRVQDDARRQNREQSPTLAGSGADATF
ncbi:MAG: caspase family protein [Elusimicrobiota bacterium]